MVDPLVQAAGCVDGGVGVQATAADAAGGNLVQRLAWLAVQHFGTHRHLGHPQGGWRYPGAQQPAPGTDRQGNQYQRHGAAPVVDREAAGQAGERQGHGRDQGQLEALRGGQMQDDRQCGQQGGEQRQGMQRQEQPAPRCQPLVVQRVDDRNQARGAEQAGEYQLAAVPGGGDEEERQHEEQRFLVDHLRRVAQQRLRDFAVEGAGEQAGEGVFQHQPDPADQHEYGNPAGQAGLAVDQDEAADTGEETAERDDAGVAFEQFDDALDDMGDLGHWGLQQKG